MTVNIQLGNGDLFLPDDEGVSVILVTQEWMVEQAPAVGLR